MQIAIDLAPLEGLVVALSAVAGHCRLLAAAALRRCLSVNCNSSRSVRGSGGCIVGCCWPLSPFGGCGAGALS